MPKVKSDPEITSVEKETTIRFANPDDMAHIFTEQRGVISSLLENDFFELDCWRGPEGKSASVPGEDEVVHALNGTIPIGCLTIKGKPRSNNTPSGVANKTEEIPDGTFD